MSKKIHRITNLKGVILFYSIKRVELYIPKG